MRDQKNLITAVSLTLAVYLFYLATLAPTVLWGDDAFFQRSTAISYLQPDGGGHLWHFFLARLFLQLPLDDPAFLVNLLSAFAGTATILLVFACGRSLNLSNSAALAAALSLAVAHTFWTHSVRAEVYTVFMLLLALIWWLLLSWQADKPLPLYAALFLIGPTILSHQMTLLFLPALAVFLWIHRDWLRPKEWSFILASFLTGLILAAALIHLQVGRNTLIQSLSIYFTQSGSDFSQAFFDISPHLLASDINFWLAMLGLQFVGPALLLAFSAVLTIRTQSKPWLPLLVFYCTTVLFAISYRVNDRYVFFLPGYFVIALLVGLGWQTLREKRPTLARTALPLLVVIPILTYAALPSLLQTINLPLPNIRQLPGREPVSFFLWPAKNDYLGAADYGRTALNDLPPNSVLLADHTPYETLAYLQEIENIRPDVLLIKVNFNQDLSLIVQRYPPDQPIYLADNNPAYYNLSHLSPSQIIQSGLVYQILHE